MNWCRVCRKKTEEVGKCTSCLTQLTKWFEPRKPAPKCPRCGKQHSKATQDGSRICTDCGAEFEPVEVSFADSRPVENSIKREQHKGRR